MQIKSMWGPRLSLLCINLEVLKSNQIETVPLCIISSEYIYKHSFLSETFQNTNVTELINYNCINNNNNQQ